jgi:hypothetical protein
VVGDDTGLSWADTTGDSIVAGQFQPDDEISPTGRAQSRNKFRDYACAAIPVTAKFVFPPVGPRGEELMEQMPMPSGYFDAGETTVFQVCGRLHRLCDQVANFARRQGVWHSPGKIIGQGGSAKRLGVPSRKMASAAGILDLTEKAAILTFYGTGEVFQSLGVIAPPNLHAGQINLMAHHAEWLRHRHGSTTSGAVGVVLNHSFRHLPLRGYH